MRARPGARASFAVALTLSVAHLCPHTAAAEEISLLAGVTDTDDHTHTTYAWGLEYRQALLAHLDASFGYLNEGHLPEHHRDGGLLQFWADSGLWHNRFTFALGAGPYVYFDTQFDDNYAGYQNQHGVGLIVSGRATYSLSSQWFALLDVNQVMFTNPGTRTFMLGIGYRLEQLSDTLERASRDDQTGGANGLQNEVGFFVGQTVLNNLSSNKSTDFGFEYRYRWGRHLELSTSVLNEGTGAVDSHASVTGEVWAVQDFLSHRLSFGLGAGPYVALNAYQTTDGRNGASVIGLASLTVSWRFTRPLVLRLSWHRAFTSDDQDRDILTAGFGLRF